MARDKYVVLLNNRVRFTTTEPVAVDDVIASLRGMDHIVRHHFPKAIKNLTGAKVESVELLVTGVEDGSVIEDTVIKLIFNGKDEYEKFIGGIRSKFVSKNPEGDTVVKGWVAGSLLAGIAILGIAVWQLSGKSNATPAGGLITVNGDDNVIITIGAESYEKSPEEFQKALESVVSRKRPASVAKAGAQFFAPARAEEGAGLTLESGRRSVEVVSPATIRKVPVAIEKKDTSEDSSFKNVDLKLRAQDSDSESRGWAGTIDRFAETRTRVVFADPRDVNKAMFKPEIQADVTITYSDALHTTAKLIIVEKVY